MFRSAHALVLGGALLACDDPRDPLDLDEIEGSADDCLTVVHAALAPDIEIHRYLGDSSDSPGGWAVATILDASMNPRIALVRIPASPDEPAIDPIEFGVTSLDQVDIELHAGVGRGELWVLQRSGSTVMLRQFAPGVGVVAGNGQLANFPITEGFGGCPTKYERQLLLIEGQPYILAIPNCSETSALELQLLRLDSTSLAFMDSWVLTFNACGDDVECIGYIPAIGSGESSQNPGAERVSVGLSQLRDFGQGLTSTDVSLLELRMNAGTPTARLVTFRQVWLTPTSLGPVHLAQDPFSIQLHVRDGAGGGDGALLRFDAIGELYIQITTPPLLPLDGAGELLQLDTQSVIVDVHGDDLDVVPLIDVESWPIWAPRTVYSLDGLIDVEPAGVGQLLLRRDQAAPQIVQLRCLE